jgi:hypothetical protein
VSRRIAERQGVEEKPRDDSPSFGHLPLRILQTLAPQLRLELTFAKAN